ncbi:hypothetical protein, unlikely [Trypanosoma brucei gambiense DAL972]|uniref:Uncharacterized protein n=1 Tax=Trypanosoma brucei gambiense (strain MHOM/CI/86/DAL972) TaxID=679716 RepID=C9ZSI1_TRYB9|nr:hypothetical protein, unlikely [Trypanosoma brucei gambiense DAL972]CBH12365.1 hypothetical protein, unlikely [Trypanosoma brucei gambiense DAL972]|eukprot:XP_011774646.1 hypothetical protein, unlikely [Trypanosoma brucei gambiense DAL972]
MLRLVPSQVTTVADVHGLPTISPLPATPPHRLMNALMLDFMGEVRDYWFRTLVWRCRHRSVHGTRLFAYFRPSFLYNVASQLPKNYLALPSSASNPGRRIIQGSSLSSLLVYTFNLLRHLLFTP